MGGTWSAGGNLATARYYLAGCGTQTAGLSFGGYTTINVATTEEYDGTSWAAGGDLGTARRFLAGCGTQTAGLSFGGWIAARTAITEEYDGTSWAAGGNLGTARYYLAGCGTQTAGLSFGGYTTLNVATTEEYDGTSWAAGGNLGTARSRLAGCGTQTAGLSFGGYTTLVVATTEEYDGTSWAAGGDLGTARRFLAGCGTQTAGLSFGGWIAASTAITEEYDGTSWAAGGNLGTARNGLGGCGTQAAGLSFGGQTTVTVATTEEYIAASYYIKGYAKLGGVGLAGVLVTLSGASSNTYTTIADGYYEFLNLAGDNYTVTPTKTHYTFAPVNYSYSPLAANQDNQDFTATPVPYYIKGYCLDSVSAGITGVLVTLSGASSNTYTTIADGYYEFLNLTTGNYYVSPAKADTSFDPISKDYIPLIANQNNQDFLGTFIHTFTDEMDQKIGTKPILRVQITTSGATTDVTSYLKSCGSLDMEKGRTGEEALVAAGDMMFVFSNYDDKFTELDASSIFYGVTYIGKTIDIDFGFRKDDGTIEYADQAVFKIINVYLNSESSECYIVGQDNINRLNKFVLNVPANVLVPVPGANTGNGYITEIQTKPFGTVSENWTITCTLGGGVGVATFSVVGSTSGNIGTATSDVEFSTGNKIKFTIYAGGTNWVISDSFTFTTRQNIEFTNLSPIKIIWSILTGHNYDTNIAEAWHNATPQMDNTKSTANIDLNFPSFTTAITDLGTSFNLTGYIGMNENCSSVISSIILHFLGAVYTDADGKIYIETYKPSLGESPREFSSSKKITTLKYQKDYNGIINSCTANYKKTASWAWSGEEETTDGMYTKTNSLSITSYGEKTYTIGTKWLSINNNAIQWTVDRIVDRYANPPLIIDFTTGTDAIQTFLGDRIKITDTKTQLSEQIMEVNKLSKDFSSKPTRITISCVDTGTTGWSWAFCGSSINETDHDWSIASSQVWDTATNFEKQFCYASQTGGEGTPPDFYVF